MHQAMARATYLVTLGFFVVAPRISRAADVPSYVNVRSAVSAGSGCESRQVRVVVSNDKQFLFLQDGTLEVNAGPDLLPAEGRKFCQIAIDLDVEPGFSYAVSSALPHRGFVSLEEGVTATLSIERYFTGEGPTLAPFEWTFRGPMSEQRFARLEPTSAMSSFSPCDRDSLLNLKTSVRVSNLGSPLSSGSMRTTPPWGFDGLKLHWRRC